jgi:fluoroquinolone resistance protein
MPANPRVSLLDELAGHDAACLTDLTFAGDLLEGETVRGLEADGCTFTGSLEGAAVRSSTLTECAFTGANLSRVDLTDTRLVDCTFSRCKILAVNFAATGVGAISATPVVFESCQLDYSSFQDVDAAGFVFRDCSLREVDFTGARLQRAVFTGCRLEGARFARADLSESDLREATGYAIDPRETKLRGARFSPADALALLAPFGIVVD